MRLNGVSDRMCSSKIQVIRRQFSAILRTPKRGISLSAGDACPETRMNREQTYSGRACSDVFKETWSGGQRSRENTPFCHAAISVRVCCLVLYEGLSSGRKNVRTSTAVNLNLRLRLSFMGKEVGIDPRENHQSGLRTYLRAYVQPHA